MPLVALEWDTSDQDSYIPQVESIITQIGFGYQIVNSDQIRGSGLEGFDVLLFPGGFGAVQGLKKYGDAFGNVVRNFVSKGGGFLGVCGGAYVAGMSLSGVLGLYCPTTLRIINISAATPAAIKYLETYIGAQGQRLRTQCHVVPVLNPIVTGYEGQNLDMVYSLGPVLSNPGLDVTILLTYINNLMPAGSIAVCCANYGRGRVLISSPHPETPWGPGAIGIGCQQWLYERMLSWAAHTEQEVPAPSPPSEQPSWLPLKVAGGILGGLTLLYGLSKLQRRHKLGLPS